MREIKFKAKDINNYKWVHGHYTKLGRSFLYDVVIETDIIITKDGDYQIIPETVKQYTGFKDKNGEEIYEGDIIHVIEVMENNLEEYNTDILWEDGSFVIKSKGANYYDTYLGGITFSNSIMSYPLFEVEIIGNTFDHPKLLWRC